MRILPFAVLALLAATPAAAADPAAATIASFDDALTAAAAAGKASPLAARTAKLLPVVRATHDLPTMAALVAGPAWTGASAADRAALVEAFARHSALSYAANFTSPARFTLDPKIIARGGDRVVRTRVDATPIDYRLRDFGGSWRIVDIFAEGVSQVAVQRSEFAATVKAGGVAGLAQKLSAADEARLKAR